MLQQRNAPGVRTLAKKSLIRLLGEERGQKTDQMYFSALRRSLRHPYMKNGGIIKKSLQPPPLTIETVSTIPLTGLAQLSPVLREEPVSQLLNYQTKTEEDAYVSMLAAIVQHIRRFGFAPSALYINEQHLFPYLEAIRKTEQREPKGSILFCGQSIRLLTETQLPQWARVHLQKAIPLDIIFAAS